MNLLIYTSLKNTASKRLINEISDLTARENTEIFNTFNSLVSRGSKLGRDQTIVLLMAATEEDVFSALYYSDFLQDCRLILVLPDRDANTISTGYKLFPRYVSYIDSDFSDVIAVLNKMIENLHNMQTRETPLLKRMNSPKTVTERLS